MKRTQFAFICIFLLLAAFPAIAMGKAPSKSVIVTGYQTLEGVIYLYGNVPFTELVLESGMRDGDPKGSVRLVGNNLPKLISLQHTFTRVEGAVVEKKSKSANFQMDVVKYQLIKGGNE
jgi:hypothetical protein